MSVQRTRDAVERYLNSAHQDLGVMSKDVVFTNMATGDEHRGVDEVRRMLDYVYHQAFDASAETRNRIYAEDHAVLEGYFVGKHIGAFAGVQATGRQVRVPLCVVYDLEDGQIARGRVYLEVPAMMRQLGANTA